MGGALCSLRLAEKMESKQVMSVECRCSPAASMDSRLQETPCRAVASCAISLAASCRSAAREWERADVEYKSSCEKRNCTSPYSEGGVTSAMGGL